MANVKLGDNTMVPADDFLLHRRHAKYSDATKYIFPTATTCLAQTSWGQKFFMAVWMQTGQLDLPEPSRHPKKG